MRSKTPKRWVKPNFSQQGTGPLNLQNVVSILATVGEDVVRKDVNQLALMRGINLCLHWYQDARFFGTNREERDRKKRLEMIDKKAKALDLLLSEDHSWLPIGARPSSSSAYRAPVKQLLESVDRALARSPSDGMQRAYRDSFKVRSPFEWLVAYFLSDVFMFLDIAPIATKDEMLSQESPSAF